MDDQAIGLSSNEALDKSLAVEFREMERRQGIDVVGPLPWLPMHPSWKSGRIAFRDKGKISLIDTADVVAVEGRGSYVLLKRPSKSHMLRESLSSSEKKLSPYGFVRINRSVLVNAALVEEIQSRLGRVYVVRIKGGIEYTVTRTYKKNLQLLAQLWIGTAGFVMTK